MSKRKMDSKLKIIKDLSFLLDHRPLPLDSHTTKYVLLAGEGDTIRQMNHDFNIVYSFKSYSFEGRNLNGFPEGKMAKFDQKDPIMLKLLTSMKVEEKAWFNVCEEPVFKLKKTKEQEEEAIDELEGIEDVQLTA